MKITLYSCSVIIIALIVHLSCPQPAIFNYISKSSGPIYSLSDVGVTLPIVPILLDDVVCIGNETSLVQCSHNGFNEHNCDNSEDIVLMCVGKRITQFMYVVLFAIVCGNCITVAHVF